jgi:dolichyl-phosphate-mannose--protein O-mannosyl transferase
METETRVRWTRGDWVALVALTLGAGILRFVRLATPSSLIGDEGFYVNDACWYLHSSGDACDIGSEMNLEHPPLGKWIIAASMRLFGESPYGSRVLIAILGTLTIPLVYVLARRLLRSSLGASVAAGLLVVDFAHFPLSRTAMLDVPLVFFSVLALLFMAIARDAPEGKDLRWRCAAGAAAGAAVATKWTALAVLAALFALAYAWDVFARRGPHERHPIVRAARHRGWGWVVAFVVVPAFVYALAFIGRIHGDLLTLPWADGSWLSALWERQLTTFEFHAQHIWAHPQASEPAMWLLAKRAFVMARDLQDGEKIVIVTGNPVVWTAGALAILYMAVRWFRDRRVRSPEGFVLMGFAFSYLPWFIYQHAPWVFFTWGRVATFIFYFLPTVPFIYLALGYVADRAARNRGGRAAVGVGLALAAALFAIYYPLMTYVQLSDRAFDARLFAFDQCQVSGDKVFLLNPTTLPNGRISYGSTNLPARFVRPPDGWCWR